MRRFTTAIVRKPGDSFARGITAAGLGEADPELARFQHQAYCRLLAECGLEVHVLDPEPDFPDSTFVEDGAVVLGDMVVLARPGAESRRSEAALLRPVLETFFPRVEEIEFPGLLEGGDVLKIEGHVFIGLSSRTNVEGAEQLGRLAEQEGFTWSVLPSLSEPHLKSGVSEAGEGTLLMAGEYERIEDFGPYRRIVVEPGDEYSANCLALNGTIILPEGFSATSEKLAEPGLPILTAPMSEFRKMDGGLTCLSLRF